MTRLRTEPNLDDPDGFYEELLSLHEGRSKDESDAVNARLVLILANHIGDRQVLREAFRAAGSPTDTGGGARGDDEGRCARSEPHRAEHERSGAERRNRVSAPRR